LIITRSPLRISLGGGGTDLPSFYRLHGGHVVSAAIDKYVYVNISRPFQKGIILKYSKLEKVEKIADVQHPIIREALESLSIIDPQLEITSIADVPAGTGLGSSGSFTTALLKNLHTYYRRTLLTHDLANMACEIEIDKLGEPIGKQDQFISAYGGIMDISFETNDNVIVKPLDISTKTLLSLEDNLLLFFTGISRSASSILSDQNDKSMLNEKKMLENLNFIKELGFKTSEVLSSGNLEEYGQLLNEHWQYKKTRSARISSEFIEDAYNLGIKNGAIGGKLVGAGGGGFILFYANDREKLRNAMQGLGLEELRFRFDFEGTKVILS
jgi:D-glycero-alpha-D-manno-heptose-7-phosphate kinase